MANGTVRMWVCSAGHDHKKKRVAERCSARADRRASISMGKLYADAAMIPEDPGIGTSVEVAES